MYRALSVNEDGRRISILLSAPVPSANMEEAGCGTFTAAWGGSRSITAVNTDTSWFPLVFPVKEFELNRIHRLPERTSAPRARRTSVGQHKYVVNTSLHVS